MLTVSSTVWWLRATNSEGRAREPRETMESKNRSFLRTSINANGSLLAIIGGKEMGGGPIRTRGEAMEGGEWEMEQSEQGAGLTSSSLGQ